MSAFDTTTNTGSTTFTNAYNTVELLPSASVQKAGGFVRTLGWLYWEMVIDDQGGDQSRLFVGATVSPYPTEGAQVFGGMRADAVVAGTTFNPPYPYNASSATSITACTGDVFMFAIDMTGQGRGHDGTVRVSPLPLMSGTGQTLTAVFLDIGKNGAWSVAGIIGWAWPAMGYPLHVEPWAVRDSTSAATAKVGLRVVTTSFAYPIPSGMTAYGDGPEGAGPGATSDTYSINWDPTKISSHMSLSGSNLYAVAVGTAGPTTTSNIHVWSTVLPTTGKRYVEFRAQQSDSLTFSNWGNTEWAIGLIDANAPSLTATPTSDLNYLITKYNGGLSPVFRRAVDISGSLTNVAVFDGDQGTPSIGLMIDFDNSRMWYVDPAAKSPQLTCWAGDKNAAGFSPYGYSFGAVSSISGITISFSGGARISALIREGYFHAPTQIYLKMNPTGPFETYPLLPGATSLNGARRVLAGDGDRWDTATNPASMTYGADNLTILPRMTVALAQGIGVRYSGKKYFEIYKEGQDVSLWFGVRQQANTTMTAVSIGLLMDGGLFFNYSAFAVHEQARYGVTATWSIAELVPSSGALLNQWYGLAIDFDNGRLWGGIWNKVQHRMDWGTGSDPVTGLSPHMTFTASTTMRIAVVWEATSSNRVVMVANPSNVIGLPSGFTTWDAELTTSLTATPSAGATGLRNIWPTGMVG